MSEQLLVRLKKKRKKRRTDLEKCTRQCYETQGNNSTRALSAKMIFLGSECFEFILCLSQHLSGQEIQKLGLLIKIRVNK